MRAMRTFTAVLASTMIVGCNGSDSPLPTAPDPTPSPGVPAPSPPGQGSRTVSFLGTVAAAGDQSGTIEIVVPAAPESSGVSVHPMTVVEATGTVRLLDSAPIALRGTYDDEAGPLTLTGGGFSVQGSIPPEARGDASAVIEGTLTTPQGQGVFSTINAGGGSVRNYCGRYRMDDGDGGTWNFSIGANGRVTGVGRGDGGPFRLSGQANGDRVTLRVVGEAGSCSLTIRGSTIGGGCDDTRITGSACG